MIKPVLWENHLLFLVIFGKYLNIISYKELFYETSTGHDGWQ